MKKAALVQEQGKKLGGSLAACQLIVSMVEGLRRQVVRPMKRILEGKMSKFLVGQTKKDNGKTCNVESINMASSNLCL